MLNIFRPKISLRDKSENIYLPEIPENLVNNHKKLIKKLTTKNETIFKKLERIYKFTDLYNRFVSTFSVCKKSCSHCCNIDVLVTEIEAELIAVKLNWPIDRSRTFTANHTTPCPFLDSKNKCSIYKVRPFNCRTFHTLDDPKYCESGEVHNIYGTPDNNYSNTMLKSCSVAISEMNSNNLRKDIRDFFKKS